MAAERLRLLEFGALLRVEEDPPPYLRAAIGAPFPPQLALGRRAWLKAAGTIEQVRADQAITDPDVALGLEPSDPGARHLYDLAHQTLTVIRRDLALLHANASPFERATVDLAREPIAQPLHHLEL
jgi:hypothetical protein